MALINRTSALTGKSNYMDLPYEESHFTNYNNGMSADKAFPGITADQLTFLTTGVTPDEVKAAEEAAKAEEIDLSLKSESPLETAVVEEPVVVKSTSFSKKK